MPAKPLNQVLSGMPQLSAAFGGWKIAIQLLKVTEIISGGFVINGEVTVNVKGTWQPLSPEEIKLKDDGQRSWEWIDLHVEGNRMVFETNDRIVKDGIRYKVMASKDYTLNNFSEYHLIRDYDDVINPPISDIDVTYLGELVTYLGEVVTYDATL